MGFFLAKIRCYLYKNLLKYKRRSKMQNLLIDSRIRDIEYDYLSQFF